jgi:5-methylcytosine-specific restriction protein B
MNNTDKLRELVVNFKESLHNSQYVIAETDLIERFVSALLSKRFLILSGLAGSGKTKIAQYFAYWLLGKNSTAVGVIPVGADWVSNEQLFGYPDGLQSGVYVSKPVLNLVLHAIKNPNMPHILILDEMNLSHVERYFSDFLSAIESGEPIPLYEGAERFAAGEFVPRKLILPNNLFIIGTINVDETTYTFSPKVLDRANVIEFRMTVDMVKAYLQQQSMLDDQKLDSQGKMFQHHIVQWSSNIIQYFEMNNDWNTYYADAMLDLFTQMSSARIEFGYRVLSESHKLLSVMQHLAIQPDAHTFAHAFDCVVVQKLMPKLNGSGVTLKKLLTYLSELTVNNVSLPLRNSKAKRMLEKLNQDMYVSFAEA